MPGYGAYNPTPTYQYPHYGGGNYRGPATADGVPLAGWWWRVLAVFLDGLLLNIFSLLYAQFLPDYTSGLQRWMDDYLNAASRGSLNLPDLLDPKYDLLQPLMIQVAVSLVVALLYNTAMLSFKGATVGMMACQLRVVPVDHGLHTGGLPLGKAFLRPLAYSILMFIPVVGFINLLFPLWDKGRQTLHDKIVATQVVRLA
jgi:uncharacterized RDD family membrane protein YckC